jgi:hypothetical protein
VNSQFQTDRNRVLNALNKCGVGENLDANLNQAACEVAEFCSRLTTNVMRQATYNELTNKPCGIEHRNALRMGLVTTIGALVKWDVIEALELCGDIAEDVNAHGEAKAIRAMANQIS